MVIGHNPGPILKLGMHLPEVQTWGQLQWPHRVAKSPCVMQEELPEVKDIPTGWARVIWELEQQARN